MNQYLDIIAECDKMSYPIGRFKKLEEKYGMTWEEYSALFRYTCTVGSINQGLMDNKKYTQEFVDYIYSGMNKLPKDNYPRLYAAVGFSPPLEWNLNTLRSTSFNVNTPLYFFKEVKYMAIFDDIKDKPNIYKFSMYSHEHEVLLTPQYPYNFEAYDIDYHHDKYFIYYKNKEKGEGGSAVPLKNVEDAILPKFTEYLALVQAKKVLKEGKVEWNVDNDIDIFGNNILHYYVGHSKKSEIKKYTFLLNKPNKQGITPAMKIVNKGMYDLLKKYKKIIDFSRVDNFGRNMIHYLSSRVILSNKEDLDVFLAIEILTKMCPHPFDENDIYGYNPLDYCCYSDFFMYMEQYFEKISIKPRTMKKIFLSGTIHYDSNSNVKLFIDLLLRHKISYTSEMGYFFTRNFIRMRSFTKIKSKRIKNTKDEDGENIFFAYLRYNIITSYAKEDIKHLAEHYDINLINNYGENLGMSINLIDPEKFVQVLLILKSYGINYLHRNKWGDTTSAYIVF